MAKIRHIVFGTSSGPLLRGTEPIPLPGRDFWPRAVFLTAVVETGGHFGTVMGYDKTGITAGILQEVAVFPRHLSEQGGLPKLLFQVGQLAPDKLDVIQERLDKFHQLALEASGIVRKSRGELISGKELRGVLGEPNGVTPSSGPHWDRASFWTLAIHNLLSDPRTFNLQMLLASEKLKAADPFKGEDIPPDSARELARAIYLSFWVNAPSKIRKMKEAAENSTLSYPELFPKRFLIALRNSNYANWASRYQRTRLQAMTLWPISLFVGEDAVMAP